MGLGKIKKTLNKKCPYCGRLLSLRSREIKCIENGVPATKEEDYIACSFCDYEAEVEQKRVRRKETDGIDGDIRKERNGSSKNIGNNHRGSYKRGF